MFYRILLILILAASSVWARDYKFEWQHNHPNDMVVSYRMYWRVPSNDDTWTCFLTDDGEKNCTGPTEGFIKEDPIDPENIFWSQDLGMGDIPLDPDNWPMNTMGIVTGIPEESLCFAITATDDNGYESDFSNQVCIRLRDWMIIR